MKSNDDECHLIVVNNDNAVFKQGNETWVSSINQ